MSAVKIVGIVLIVAGILGLVYGKFSYTKETHEAKIGSLELSMKDKETVNVPVWAGVGAIVVGGLLLLVLTLPRAASRDVIRTHRRGVRAPTTGDMPHGLRYLRHRH